MAITYSDLFAKLGKVGKQLIAIRTLQSTFLAVATEIITQYRTTSIRDDLVVDVQRDIETQVDEIVSWGAATKKTFDLTLSDLRDELNAPSNRVEDVLPLLVDRMVVDGAYVDANTITVGTPAIVAGSVGTGTLSAWGTKADGTTDQRITTETVILTCVKDRHTGTAAGAEVFTIAGKTSYGEHDYHAVAHGSMTNFTVASSSSINKLLNGSFTTFASQIPTNWTLTAGNIDNCNQSTANSWNENDTGSLMLTGSTAGGVDTIILTQSLVGKVLPGNQYLLSGAMSTGGSFGGASTITIALGTTNLFNGDPRTLPGAAWTNNAMLVNFNLDVPANLSLTITWSGALTAAGSAKIYIDELTVSTVSYFGHVRLALRRGTKDFVVGDTLTYTTTDGGEGVWQSLFVRHYDTALPTTGSSLINDSLLT